MNKSAVDENKIRFSSISLRGDSIVNVGYYSNNYTLSGKCLNKDYWPLFGNASLKKIFTFTKNVLNEIADKVMPIPQTIGYQGRARNKKIIFFPGSLSPGNAQSLLNWNGEISGNANSNRDIEICLKSGTSIAWQLKEARQLIQHEMAHAILDNGEGYEAAIKSDLGAAYAHNKEYFADAFTSLLAGKAETLHQLERLRNTAEAETHPSGKKRIYAVRHDIYQPVLRFSIDEIIGRRRSVNSSWEDFLANKEQYLTLQKQIDEAHENN